MPGNALPAPPRDRVPPCWKAWTTSAGQRPSAESGRYGSPAGSQTSGACSPRSPTSPHSASAAASTTERSSSVAPHQRHTSSTPAALPPGAGPDVGREGDGLARLASTTTGRAGAARVVEERGARHRRRDPLTRHVSWEVPAHSRSTTTRKRRRRPAGRQCPALTGPERAPGTRRRAGRRRPGAPPGRAVPGLRRTRHTARSRGCPPRPLTPECGTARSTRPRALLPPPRHGRRRDRVAAS